MSVSLESPDARPHQVSVVVPVYRGATTLPDLVAELAPWTRPFVTAEGHRAVVTEVLLVHDHGPDDSARVIRELASSDLVRPVWLARNFGQHAATMAGMASAGGEWILTMDEDGQHDPAALPAMLDTAMREQAGLVYAAPTNAAPHGAVRNLSSRGAKRVIDVLSGSRDSRRFHSFRLVLGESGRSVAAYAGAGVYLDVALGWVCGDVATCPVRLRQEGDRPSGYRTRTLLSHFWRLVLTSGTRLLRMVSLLGVLFASLGMVFAVYLVVLRLLDDQLAPGWTSVMVVTLLAAGAVLFSIGVVAEYVGVAVNMAMGKPLYVITRDPRDSALGRPPAGPFPDGGA